MVLPLSFSAVRQSLFNNEEENYKMLTRTPGKLRVLVYSNKRLPDLICRSFLNKGKPKSETK
jgi:hypothetical protein